eukprot:Colp12_sorted_trinity150504_noHs@31464
MGLIPSHPLSADGYSFHDPADYDTTGAPLIDPAIAAARSEDKPLNEYQILQKAFWDSVIQAREEAQMKKMRVAEANYAEIAERWPHWSEEDVHYFHRQFKKFDKNQDKSIDFNELCMMLDELGDRSTLQERQKSFAEQDADNSGAIDFEEFLVLIDKVQRGQVDPTSGISRLLMELNNGAKKKISLKGPILANPAPVVTPPVLVEAQEAAPPPDTTPAPDTTTATTS